MVHAVATIEIGDGKRDAFLRDFHELVPKVYLESGCHEYAPFVDADTGIEARVGHVPTSLP